eukprot:8620577-Pyramimonas_sp.AAC.1
MPRLRPPGWRPMLLRPRCPRDVVSRQQVVQGVPHVLAHMFQHDVWLGADADLDGEVRGEPHHVVPDAAGIPDFASGLEGLRASGSDLS